MSDLVRKAGILSASDFIRLAVKTLIGIVLARILSQADYGTYRQLFMIYTLLFSIFMIGLPQSIYYFIPKSDPLTQKRFLRQTLDVFTLLGLVSSIVLFTFRYDIARLFNNQDLSNSLLLYAFYPFFMFVSQLYYTAMISLQQTRNAAKFTLFSVACDTLLTLGIAILTKNLNYIVVGIMLSVFIQWLYARVKISSYTRLDEKHRIDISLLKQQLIFSLPLGIASIIGVVTAQLDKLIISTYFTPEQFAVFAVGAAELPFIFIIANSVNSVILPAMNKCTTKEQISSLYNGAVRKNALLIFPLFVFCFLFATPIIRFLYSDKYIEAVKYFRIYLFSMPLRIATYGIVFQVCNRTKYIFSISVITLILNIVLSIILIRLIGMKGPALSTTIATFINVSMYIGFIKSKLHFELRSLFPLKALFLTMLAALTTGIVCFFIIFTPLSDIGKLVLAIVIYSAVYIFIGSKFKAILDYDRKLVLNIINETTHKIKHNLTKHNRNIEKGT